jgi:MFS family permease
LFLLPSTIAMLVAGSQAGRLERRFGSKPPLLAGAAATAASYALLAVARSERWEIYVASVLLGTGIGLAFAAMVNLIIENVGPAETGIATGMNTVTRTVGGAFGGSAVASILAASVGGSGFPSAHGFTVAFAACAVAVSLGVIVGLAIPQRRPADAFVVHEAGELPEQASV